MAGRRPTDRDFRLARLARERYHLADLTLEPDVATARTIAGRLAAGRTASQSTPTTGTTPAPGSSDRPVSPGDLQAAGILVAILGRLIDHYRELAETDPLRVAADELAAEVGPAGLDATLAAFPLEFPRSLDEPEAADPDVALAQLVLLGVLSDNPAVAPFGELIDLEPLSQRAAAVATLQAALETSLDGSPAFPGDARSLMELLREPARAAPDSLADQLRYIRGAWADRFGPLLDDLFERLLVALDVLAEEDHAAKLAWRGGQADPGQAGPAEVYTFGSDPAETEQFSLDTEWMPSLVLVAKSTYVWLDQLSRAYRREIRTLDAVPDAELAVLAARGMTGLWLIGLWERSRASARIKHLRGQPEAVASAYSLDDYVIAQDLGGPAALADLRSRAGRHGVRLASDMVPNHMGIDSRWVIDHPERFLSVAEAPFPAYSFNGPDLSDDERVGIRIEDHYYDASDAAVVFQRTDRATGAVRYVYHGNDGTSFPWNDTAQLDYSQAAVREAVIQTIVAVARQFPVIRFDAAMVLVKRHIERLWFPEPGAGGAIPSRAGQGLSRRAFEALVPHEFWREVVDRVALEAPGTLLLAEAFWLLEGYFVRTLGMHRVYNSAFMNMLRDELNADYRLVIKNTLEFDPAILGRFVNFMSNPDEKTAVEQFGTGEKYFGVAAMLATLPGLPMFGHGQAEGFHEQYGMEFRQARLEEAVDAGLLAHHDRTIFPLLHRRAEFAGSSHFRLFDFETAPGVVNEDVFAYTNRGSSGASLVLFHNRYAQTEGRLRLSAAFAQRTVDGDRPLVRSSIAESLDLPDEPGHWLILRDAMSGLEELRSTSEIATDGFAASLGTYGCRVYVDLRVVADGPDEPWSALAGRLAGRAVPSLAEALADLRRSSAIVRALAGAGPALLGSAPAAVQGWFGDSAVRSALRVNAWDGGEYVEREAWLAWLAALAELTGTARSRRWPALARSAEKAGYRVDRILAGLALSRRPGRPGPARAGATAKASRDRGRPPGGGAG